MVLRKSASSGGQPHLKAEVGERSTLTSSERDNIVQVKDHIDQRPVYFSNGIDKKLKWFSIATVLIQRSSSSAACSVWYFKSIIHRSDFSTLLDEFGTADTWGTHLRLLPIPFILLQLVADLDIDIGQTADDQVWLPCSPIESHQVASSWDHILSGLSCTMIEHHKIINYATCTQ